MIPDSFDLSGRVAVVTGGYGVIGASLAEGLAAAGVRVGVLGRRADHAAEAVARIVDAGGEACPLVADVLDEPALIRARGELLDRWGGVDILVNAAGGHVARARTDDRSTFQMPLDAFDEVVRLNLHGTLIPTHVFGEAMAERRRGSIVNISSMAAQQAFSGVLGYSVAKAAIDNFTRWMAMELARRFGDGLRVNAIAPGFFVTNQNRAVMLRPDGGYTERSARVIARTPMGRLGEPRELNGVVHWLCSDAATFVTGAVIPVDGGFSAFSGI